ncbi:IclR family transcriptional regulator [Betaproteobacteria bacterium GR16-43]|nr:IclR family transcriptional regulator [Betaproteobacteria bacterium GR16-43]
MPKKSSAETGGVAAVDRALMLLCAFRDGDRTLSLSELAERTQLVKSTTLRLLASLGHFGFVQRGEDGTYSLGPEVARLQGTFTASFSLEAVVIPALQALNAATGETAVFHVLRGAQRISLYRVNSSKPLHVHVQVGDVMPLDRGAGGRVLTAFSGGRGAIYERIRRDGYACLQGDRVPDLAGISAPVLGPGGELVGAVTLTYPSHRHKDRFLGPVREAARAVGAKLGGTPT